MPLQPGDLDKVRFAVHESRAGTTTDVVKRSGVPWYRVQLALTRLVKSGEVHCSEGHQHADRGFCQCDAGEQIGLPKVVEWHLSREDESCAS